MSPSLCVSCLTDFLIIRVFIFVMRSLSLLAFVCLHSPFVSLIPLLIYVFACLCVSLSVSLFLCLLVLSEYSPCFLVLSFFVLYSFVCLFFSLFVCLRCCWCCCRRALADLFLDALADLLLDALVNLLQLADIERPLTKAGNMTETVLPRFRATTLTCGPSVDVLT